LFRAFYVFRHRFASRHRRHVVMQAACSYFEASLKLRYLRVLRRRVARAMLGRWQNQRGSYFHRDKQVGIVIFKMRLGVISTSLGYKILGK
jgi:hypothetical protein